MFDTTNASDNRPHIAPKIAKCAEIRSSIVSTIDSSPTLRIASKRFCTKQRQRNKPALPSILFLECFLWNMLVLLCSTFLLRSPMWSRNVLGSPNGADTTCCAQIHYITAMFYHIYKTTKAQCSSSVSPTTLQWTTTNKRKEANKDAEMILPHVMPH